MRYYTLTMILLFCNIFSFSQTESEENFFNSYLLFKKAEINIYQKNYKQASEQCEQAFEIANYYSTTDLYIATICAALSQDTNKMFSYMEMTLKRGILFSRYEENPAFVSYIDLPQWQELKNNQQNYYLHYEASINKEYKHILDSLDKEDQRVRKKLKGSFWTAVLPKSKMSKKNIKSLQYVDSSAMAIFYKYYDKYGYPYEGNIGKPDISKSPLGYIFLYHHYGNSAFIDKQRQAVLDGKMPLYQYEFKLRYIRLAKNETLSLKTPSTPLDTLLTAFTIHWEFYKDEQSRQLINDVRKAINYLSVEEEQKLRQEYKEDIVYYQFYNPWGWSKLGNKK